MYGWYQLQQCVQVFIYCVEQICSQSTTLQLTDSTKAGFDYTYNNAAGCIVSTVLQRDLIIRIIMQPAAS